MGQAAGDQEALRCREAHAHLHRTRRPFLEREVHVHQIIGARYRRGFHFGFFDEWQARQTHPRALDRTLGERRGFQLPHFAAQGLVIGTRMTAEIDPPHIGALAGFDEVVERDLTLFFIYLWQRGDFGEGVAYVGQRGLDAVGTFGGLAARELVAGAGGGHRIQIGFVELDVTGKTPVGDGIHLALSDVQGDVDVLLVRRQGHLHRGDIELQIAAILIIGRQ